MFSGLCQGRLSLALLWAPGPLLLPKAHSWRFSARGALSLILLWECAFNGAFMKQRRFGG